MIIFRKEDKEWLLVIWTIIHIMLSEHITEPNFSINYPVPTRVPSMLMDLPVLGDTFCRFCTRRVCLLPPLWHYGDPTQSLICKSPLDSSSSFFPASWFPLKLLMLLLFCPWWWGIGIPSRVHRIFSTQNPKSQCSMAEKCFLGFLCAKGEGSGRVEKLSSVLDFTRCLTFNLSNEPKI